jgi:hypothetical protein
MPSKLPTATTEGREANDPVSILPGLFLITRMASLARTLLQKTPDYTSEVI